MTRGPSSDGVPAAKVTVTVVSRGKRVVDTNASHLPSVEPAIRRCIRESEAISSLRCMAHGVPAALGRHLSVLDHSGRIDALVESGEEDWLQPEGTADGIGGLQSRRGRSESPADRICQFRSGSRLRSGSDGRHVLGCHRHSGAPVGAGFKQECFRSHPAPTAGHSRLKFDRYVLRGQLLVAGEWNHGETECYTQLRGEGDIPFR